ncbi:Paladin [Sciurus carolinensis]|uniref:Paladin n=1 Tax=Sciurus carolinensis TaxID=30640 RepID=A0AA41MUS0_SCICA|nr:Paladin [Sciurus carolinensis]
MGTTASTAQQTVSAGAPFEGLQGGSTMFGQHSLSIHSFQTMNLHNSKAKFIIPNKVAPVVITYNCKEEFQVYDELLKAQYGRKVVEEVDRAIATYAELRNLKEVVLESQRQLEGIQSRVQGSSGQHEAWQRVLQSVERYFYLVLFNYYLHKQNSLAFALSFSRWLCAHHELYCLPVTLSSAGPLAPRDLLAKGSPEVDDLVSPDTLSTIREMGPTKHQVPDVPHHAGGLQPAPQGLPRLAYHHILVPNLCTPWEEDFHRLLEALPTALAKDPGSGSVFTCLSGQGRTMKVMVVALLDFWSIQGYSEVGEEELVSVPDAKFTKDKFQVVMEVVHLLPDGHLMKKEVDMALDMVSETMTPMHYHLQEIIICTYCQVKAAKEEQEAWRLQLQYLECYVYLILFNAYLYLEKARSWQRTFSTWMWEVASKAGIYEILD